MTQTFVDSKFAMKFDVAHQNRELTHTVVDGRKVKIRSRKVIFVHNHSCMHLTLEDTKNSHPLADKC